MYRRALVVVMVVATAVVGALAWGGAPAPALGASGSQDPRTEDAGAPTTAAPIVTTTLPAANGDVGRIIPLPNSGVEPTDPGERGGWQQLALFLMVCGVIIGMALFVWWRSRLARTARRAAGHDPVTMAREHGGDVRRPRPPGTTE